MTWWIIRYIIQFEKKPYYTLLLQDDIPTEKDIYRGFEYNHRIKSFEVLDSFSTKSNGIPLSKLLKWVITHWLEDL